LNEVKHQQNELDKSMLFAYQQEQHDYNVCANNAVPPNQISMNKWRGGTSTNNFFYKLQQGSIK
jgi:hypothetical protein